MGITRPLPTHSFLFTNLHTHKFYTSYTPENQDLLLHHGQFFKVWQIKINYTAGIKTNVKCTKTKTRHNSESVRVLG